MNNPAASLLAQLYPNWQAWLPVDALPKGEFDKRLKIIPDQGQASDWLGAGLTAFSGRLVLPMPCDTILSERALYALAAALRENPQAVIFLPMRTNLTRPGVAASHDLLASSVGAVLFRTDYPSLELLIVDNSSQEPEAVALLQYLADDPRVRILTAPGPFNYAALNNMAARATRGDVLVLLNSDTDALNPDWLREMVSHAVRGDVGVVGAKLFYENGRVQHAGVGFDKEREFIHPFRLSSGPDPGPDGELALTRTVSGGTTLQRVGK